MNLFNRLAREKITVEAMIEIYCRLNHSSSSLCGDCKTMLQYAMQRLEKCPFGYEKPICSKCLVHCYSKEMQERIKAVMRFSGPKMITRHPILALFHIYDSKIEAKLLRKKRINPQDSVKA